MMKKIFTVLALITISLRSFAPGNQVMFICAGDVAHPFEALWQAVCAVESSGNSKAYNELGNAVGIAQIRQIRLDDYNHRAGKSYKLDQMYDPDKSKEVFLYYASTLKTMSFEVVCRLWNGGPRGMSKEQTLIYFSKIQKHLNQTT